MATSYRRRQPEKTVLYVAVQSALETFLAECTTNDRPLPFFVERELRAFLSCGILAEGFARVRCERCGHDRVVAFSCKGRAFCPSCVGRSMADTAAHLVDNVLPHVPYRQWVLTLPPPLRYRLACDAELLADVLDAFKQTRDADDLPQLRQGIARFEDFIGYSPGSGTAPSVTSSSTRSPTPNPEP